MNPLSVAIGILLGLVIGWLLATRRTQADREARVAAETRLEGLQEQLAAQQSLLEAAKAQLSDSFKALSLDALQANSRTFEDRTRQTLEPLQEALRRYEDHIHAIEQARERAYGTLEQQVRQLAESEQRLQQETHNLVTALRRPEVRGRWGELTLHRVVELAGLVEHCDFSEQVHTVGETGALRPDMVVHLPGGRDIIVDSKVPLDGYLSAVEAPDEEARKACLARHGQHLRQHINALATKAYWDQFPSAPEFVVMFVPGEAFLSAAASADPELIEDGMGKRVFAATPITLVALLRTVAHGWRQDQIGQNAQQISDLGRQLYDRMRTFAGHLANLGKRLDSAGAAYNEAIGSLERNVLPAARRFRDLGAATGADIPGLEALDGAARPLTAPELVEDDTPG
jgi:DNA recombination protein RmuC